MECRKIKLAATSYGDASGSTFRSNAATDLQALATQTDWICSLFEN